MMKKEPVTHTEPIIGTTTQAVLYLRVSTREQAERGGKPEGFSIPAQREACSRRAEQLGARVVDEFIDAGESARSASRPELQRMLAYLAENPTTYVIVHKVDRLARSRADDIEINLAIRKAGSTLISVTENVDQTPSGMLLHGIMSSIAEFYSQNLAAEVVKGTEQKVRAGGTPTLAPIGYLNFRTVTDGRDIRTIVLDPQRSLHIRWAFETYASGDWSLNRLAAELEIRGLTRRPTATRDARPVPANKLHEILQNRYYIGYVTWRGVEYPGKHEPLIDTETFEQVQRVMQARRQSSTRPQRHTPYLAGSLYCGRCGSKLIYSVSTGRRGDKYAYWLCLGRHKYKNGCDLPYLAEEKVEDAIDQRWQHEQLTKTQADLLREGLLADLQDYIAATEVDRQRLTERIHAIRRERVKWAEKAMDESVPRDIARTKQQALAGQLQQAESQLGRLGIVQADHAVLITAATKLASDVARAYQDSSDSDRRMYNQAWFDGLHLDLEGGQTIVARADRTEVPEALLTAAFGTPPEPDTARTCAETRNGKGRESFRVLSRARGSNVPCLVELRGFEPLAPSMRTRCATGLRHSPLQQCERLPADRSAPSHRPAHSPLVELFFDVQTGQVDGVGHPPQLQVLVVNPDHGLAAVLVGQFFGRVVPMALAQARALQPSLAPLAVAQRLVAQKEQVTAERGDEQHADRPGQRRAGRRPPQKPEHGAEREQGQRPPTPGHHLATGFGQVCLLDTIWVHDGLHGCGHRTARG
jgi:site-specific DNA recombinase